MTVFISLCWCNYTGPDGTTVLDLWLQEVSTGPTLLTTSTHVPYVNVGEVYLTIVLMDSYITQTIWIGH
jgi:hypothetical protein